jgi:serine/threonine-protein kinase RIO1
MKLGLVSPVEPSLTSIEVPSEDGTGRDVLKVEPDTLVWRAPPPHGAGVAIYKMYRHRGALTRCRERLSRFRVQREYESLVHLQRNGVPCATPVTWGYGRHPQQGRFEVLVTMEIPEGQTVESYVKSAARHDERLMASAFRTVRDMHRGGVYHGRLDPRNVMFGRTEAGQMGGFIIDTPQAIVFPRDVTGTRMARHDLMNFGRIFAIRCDADCCRRLLETYGLREPLLSETVARLPGYQTTRHTRNWYGFEFRLRAFLARVGAR